MTVFVHGIFSPNGGKWGDIKTFFPSPKVYDYGWVGPLTRRRSEAAGATLAPLLQGEDVIAFSNGALVTWWALQYGARPRNIAFIQPALRKDTEIPPHTVVLYNRKDWVVMFSRLLHPWGTMGWAGSDHGINVDTGEYKIYGHTAWRRSPGVIATLIKQHSTVS